MPFQAFSTGHFPWINTKEKAEVSGLFYPSLVLSVRYSVYGKKGYGSEEVSKDETSILQTGKICYNATNINFLYVLVYVQICKRPKSLVCHDAS